MRYKNFVFETNPAKISITNSRNINEKPLFNIDSAVSNISRNAVVITGSGSVYGENAFEFAAELKRLSFSSESGWLFLPNGESYDVFFRELSVEIDSKKSGIYYTFCFVENCNHKKEKFNFDFTYAKKDENMFDIAYRCNKSVETLMRINNYKNPFDISEGDRVVLE